MCNSIVLQELSFSDIVVGIFYQTFCNYSDGFYFDDLYQVSVDVGGGGGGGGTESSPPDKTIGLYSVV